MLLLVGMVKSVWKSKKKSPFRYFNYVPIGHRNFDKHKKNHLKKTFENKCEPWIIAQ